jgi:hypothetical protein
VALGIGVASSIAEAGLLMFATTTGGDTQRFEHTADYWLTGVGIPAALASLVLLLAVHRMHGRPSDRLAPIALWINSGACLLLAAQMATGVVAGEEVRWGPSYPLATVAAFIALSLFAAGSWRSGWAPRWLLAIWPVVWVVGSMAAVGPTPLLLAGFYVTMAVVLSRRAAAG